jgi:hypothetical protein
LLRKKGATGTGRDDEPGRRTVALTRSSTKDSPRAIGPSGTAARPHKRVHTGTVASHISTVCALPMRFSISGHEPDRP